LKSLRLLLCTVAALSIAGMAQSVTSLRGRVTDPNGAVVVGAEVKLASSTNGSLRTTKSGGSGEYQFNQLMPGLYNLTVVAPGFRR
jgi:protocatechuate 3,4-dioxygenase beta subunit